MRRAELSTSDAGLFRELTAVCTEGHLAIVTAEGFPRSLAVNFAATGETIYFHGALDGEKYQRILADSRVGFSLIQALSLLPSHWFGPAFACPATQLYRSVEIKGHCRLVQDPAEKAGALQAMMDRYQPEGGFRPIAADAAMYRKALAEVGVFRIEPESWTGKVKLLQDKPDEVRQDVMTLLQGRGQPLDLLTVELMERYR